MHKNSHILGRKFENRMLYYSFPLDLKIYNIRYNIFK